MTEERELTPEQKLQIEAQKLLNEKIQRVQFAIQEILEKEGVNLIIDHAIRIVLKQ
jgi:Skp family chaperone for outer membrane proteins